MGSPAASISSRSASMGASWPARPQALMAAPYAKLCGGGRAGPAVSAQAWAVRKGGKAPAPLPYIVPLLLPHTCMHAASVCPLLTSSCMPRRFISSKKNSASPSLRLFMHASRPVAVVG